jgi:hypothetical protein
LAALAASAISNSRTPSAEARFIGEHDPQATTALGGSSPGFPHSHLESRFF